MAHWWLVGPICFCLELMGCQSPQCRCHRGSFRLVGSVVGAFMHQVAILKIALVSYPSCSLRYSNSLLCKMGQHGPWVLRLSMLRSFQGSQFWLTQADLPQRFRVAALATAVEGVGCWEIPKLFIEEICRYKWRNFPAMELMRPEAT